jgi:carbon-monoxide dehydrogenase medium subunit
VPAPAGRPGGVYLKLERKVGDFATVGVAVHVEIDDGRITTAGIGLTAVGPRNLAVEAGDALRGAAVGHSAGQSVETRIAEVAELAARTAEPEGDIRGSAEYKRHVVRVFVERGLRQAIAAASARA